jgi:hypothetical protein
MLIDEPAPPSVAVQENLSGVPVEAIVTVYVTLAVPMYWPPTAKSERPTPKKEAFPMGFGTSWAPSETANANRTASLK